MIAAAPDLDAIRAIEALPGDTARRRAVRALRRAGLAFRGKGVVGHSQFDSVDANGRQNAHVDVDTHVSFPARLRGPPADRRRREGEGRLRARRAAELPALRPPEARAGRATRRCSAARPPPTGSPCGASPPAAPAIRAVTGLELDRRLVYHAPSLALGSVERILPHYDYGATARIGGQTVQLQRVLVPAVRRGAPKVALKATADGARVTAAATVKGGTAPYTYRYGSCATTLPDDAAAAGPQHRRTRSTERPESPAARSDEQRHRHRDRRERPDRHGHRRRGRRTSRSRGAPRAARSARLVRRRTASTSRRRASATRRACPTRRPTPPASAARWTTSRRSGSAGPTTTCSRATSSIRHSATTTPAGPTTSTSCGSRATATANGFATGDRQGDGFVDTATRRPGATTTSSGSWPTRARCSSSAAAPRACGTAGSRRSPRLHLMHGLRQLVLQRQRRRPGLRRRPRRRRHAPPRRVDRRERGRAAQRRDLPLPGRLRPQRRVEPRRLLPRHRLGLRRTSRP